MKRIIFSIYTNTVDQHKSTNSFKQSQFEKYKHLIEKNQSDYAKYCNADYVLHTTTTTNYNTIQFEKILLFEKYSYSYDEVLYLDFDVVTHTNVNYFEYHDMNYLTGHSLDRTPSSKDLKRHLKNDNLDAMNMYCKTCAKKSMLLLDGIIGNNYCLNTGVIGGNSQVIQSIKFSKRLDSLHELLNEAKEDNLYPYEFSRHFYYNNEVYLSYLIERYNIPYKNIGMPWNFILDDYYDTPSDAAHFVHHVNKKFEVSFG